MLDMIPNWHPIFVHFTVALLISAVAMHVLSHFVSSSGLRSQWAIAARWNLWIGVALTFVTVAAGWYAFYTVKHDTPSHLAMIEHRNWAMATFAVFLGITGWEWHLQRRGQDKGWKFTALLVLAAGLLLATAWHGGELVYRHGLGVMALPKIERHDHAETVNGEHPHDAVPAHDMPSMDGTGTVPDKAGHAHTPGALPHKD